uniref:Uncharacterized protein n=1 Tax=Lactuca sativa TaxID=4236 RepID=A0A9R1W4Y2_LACSA|nr:hypothetical protein LSAT_V11C300136670 [Lactuca sativa]
MKSPEILNPVFFSYIRINLFSNISSPSSPPLTHLHYLQPTPTLQACTTFASSSAVAAKSSSRGIFRWFTGGSSSSLPSLDFPLKGI